MEVSDIVFLLIVEMGELMNYSAINSTLCLPFRLLNNCCVDTRCSSQKEADRLYFVFLDCSVS